MTDEIEDPLAKLAEESNPEIITESAKEVETQDILVCGKCHEVFHFVEGFQEHKSKDDCKGNGELKETLIDEKKPQIWAFTLWKNTKFKDTKEEDKPPTSWSLYQLWRSLEDTKKDAWIKAGENLQGLIEISTEFEKVQTSKMESKTEEMIENEEDTDSLSPSKEKDPLADDDCKVGSKKILKPVQMNSKKKLIPVIRPLKDITKANKVLEILSKRYNPRKKTFEYLVKWDHVDPSEPCTWEPVATLNCKVMMEEFDKKLQIQKEQQKIQKLLAKKKAKKTEVVFPEGRPQRTSKQKALNQVKVWCGNMEADENSGKRVFSDDSEDDDAFEKRLKFEEYSSDSENDTPVVTIKRIQKSQNGVEKKLTKVEPTTVLPENILIPDSKGIVRINQKQIPSLSSGVYVMSKTAGIIKLDTKASKLATSGGQTVLKVAPKIGQTSIKVIKKDMNNGTIQQTQQTKPTANILRAKPVIRNYSSKVYMQKKTNAQNAAKKAAAAAAAAAAATVTESPKDDEKDEDESDGVEELEFPTDIPIPAPDSPPPDFTLCPLTGKVLGKDGMPLEPEIKEEPMDNTATLDNLVNMAAADILDDLKDESDSAKDCLDKSNKDMDVDEPKEDASVSSTSEAITEDPIAIVTTTQTTSTQETKSTDSILSTALTNANIPIRRPSVTTTITQQRISHPKTILNRTMGQARSTPQAIITRITPGNSAVQRSRVTAPKPRGATIIRKRTSMADNALQNRSLVRRVGDTKVYTPSSSGQGHQVVSTYVATPTSGAVISMPSLMDSEGLVLQESVEVKEAKSEAVQQKPVEVQIEESPSIPTTSAQNAVSLNTLSLGDPDTPLLITGEDGTIYQVAGQNEDGQTILITRGEDGEQQCLLVAPENAGVINQVLMKPETEDAEPEQAVLEPTVEEPLTVNTETEEATDDSQVVAQIVSANPPSPGGTRKVVLMLPDGNFMMTEVTAEQYAALELDK